MKVRYYVLLLLSCLAVSSRSEAANAELSAVKNQVAALQKDVQELKAENIALKEEQVAKETATKVANENKKPGYIKIPDTDLYMKFSGFAKLVAIFDRHAAAHGPCYDFMFAPDIGIQDVNRSYKKKAGFRMHAKESRFVWETYMPLRLLGESEFDFNTFFSIDFSEGGSHDNDSLNKKMQPRVREAYAKLGNKNGDLIAGQTYSEFSDGDAGGAAETVDYNGPTGTCYIRHPLIKYTWHANKLDYALSFENPEGERINYKCQTKNTYDPTDSKQLFILESMPDLIASVRYGEKDHHHVKFAGMARRITFTQTSDVAERTVNGWGLSLSGALRFLQKDKIMASASYGNAIGKYISDADGYAVYLGSNNDTHALKMAGGFLGVQHYWNEKWALRSTAAVGFIHINNYKNAISGVMNASGTKPAVTQFDKDLHTFHVNLFTSPFGPNVDFGMEYIRGERTLTKNAAGECKKGSIDRLAFCIKAKF